MMNNKNLLSLSVTALVVIGLFYKYKGARKSGCNCNGQPGCSCSKCT